MSKKKIPKKEITKFFEDALPKDVPCNLKAGLRVEKNCEWSMKVTYARAIMANQTKFQEYVKSEFKRHLFKYSPRFNGIILSCSNIRVFTPVEATSSRFVHIRCCLDVHIFAPKIGGTLSGTVIKKGPTHISCRLYNLITVSIIKPEDVPEDKWDGNNINLHDTIVFRVLRADLDERIPSVIGHILHPDCKRNEDGTYVSIGEDNVEPGTLDMYAKDTPKRYTNINVVFNKSFKSRKKLSNE